MKTKNTTKTVKPVCTLSTKNTAVIYARVSSVGDRQSTERQVKDLSDYALYKQLEVRKVFEEHISGAKKNEERPVLCQTLEYCKENRISTLLVSELSRMGRNAFEVLASVKQLLDCGINLYIQKEQFNLLGDDGKPSLFAPIMLATLSTCAQLERENITFRLQSGRRQYVAKGGRLGRKPGSVKTMEQKQEEYKEVIALLRKGYTIRDVAKLTRKGVSTIQRVKKEFQL
jgi:DNA invertase Pin-like site-specific DNA recombinase